MTGTVNKWRVWCNTEHAWIELWDDDGEVPETCPHNNTHEIDTNKSAIVETVSSIFPLSEIGNKIAVHSSPKPTETNGTTYVVWTGAGDDMSTEEHVIGDGPLLQFQLTPGITTQQRDLKFSPQFGKVWIHEAYLTYNDAGFGDYITAYVVVSPTAIQPYANLMLYVTEDNWIKYAHPGITATHGFAASPHLIPRTYSKDGDWDYNGIELTPNLTSTGGFKISSIERHVHRFVNKIPIHGTNPYFELMSDESSLLPDGYFLRIEAYNMSDTEWNASVFIEVFREMTSKP
jgi:hypothetical protein